MHPVFILIPLITFKYLLVTEFKFNYISLLTDLLLFFTQVRMGRHKQRFAIYNHRWLSGHCLQQLQWEKHKLRACSNIVSQLISCRMFAFGYLMTHSFNTDYRPCFYSISVLFVTGLVSVCVCVTLCICIKNDCKMNSSKLNYLEV